jgi:hypothetical protein
MYLWNYKALAQDLKEHKLSSREKLKYLLAIMCYVPTGLMGSNWIPGFYRFIYRITNFIVFQQAPRVPPLKIFNTYNYFTDIATAVIIGIGVLFCFAINRRGDGRNFIERFMCLSIPVTIRISIYSLVVFILVMGSSLIFFNYKLQLISDITGFMKIFKKLRHLKELTPVMEYISYRMHIFSCGISIVALMASFVILYRSIKFISKS